MADEAVSKNHRVRQCCVDAFRYLSNIFLSNETFQRQHQLQAVGASFPVEDSALVSLPVASPAEQLSMPENKFRHSNERLVTS